MLFLQMTDKKFAVAHTVLHHFVLNSVRLGTVIGFTDGLLEQDVET